jgi:hypothetical protein
VGIHPRCAEAPAGRLDDKASRAIAREHREMSKSNLEAWETWRTNTA